MKDRDNQKMVEETIVLEEVVEGAKQVQPSPSSGI